MAYLLQTMAYLLLLRIPWHSIPWLYLLWPCIVEQADNEALARAGASVSTLYVVRCTLYVVRCTLYVVRGDARCIARYST